MRNRRSFFRKKRIITAAEWERIQTEAKAAQEILEEPRFAFLRKILIERKESIKEKYAVQSIQDAVTEETMPNNLIKKIFFPAKKEYTHLAGQYKLIEELFGILKNVVEIEKEIKHQQDLGVLELEIAKES